MANETQATGAVSVGGEVAKIILAPHQGSHPFVQREVALREAQKVGRSVDRKRISSNNLIFDCRVLSRNHALIWFENGKFYIQDTRSSNGTFVNESRLSPSGDESGPVELKSKDIVQFGVNVNVEKKVTHGCIIATIRLYINDVELPGLDPPVQQVMQIVQSALSREQELENKLVCMQDVLNAARQLATESMIAIVKEDELLSRLEMLENQLQVYSRNSPEDELKRQLVKAFEDNHKKELTSKDSLRTLLQEKLECVAKLSQIQRDYDKAEQECQRYRILYDSAKQEHSQESNKLSEQLRTAEKEKKALNEKMAEEKQILTAKLESLQAETDFTQQQLTAAKARLEETQDELFQYKVTSEAEKQRRAQAIESVSSLGDSLELHVGGGEGEVEGGGEGGEDSFRVVPEETFQLEKLEESHAPPPSIPPAVAEPHPPQLEEVVVKREEQELEKQPTLFSEAGRPRDILGVSLDSSDDDSEDEAGEKETARLVVELKLRVVGLEEELRLAEENIQHLHDELAIGKGRQSSAGTILQERGVEGEEGKERVGIREVARKVSEVAIAKGQVDLLQLSLSESERRIQDLQADLQMEVEKRCMLQESQSVLGGQLNQCYAELEAKQMEVLRIRDELRKKEGKVASLQKELQRWCGEADQLRESCVSMEGELTALQEKYSCQLEAEEIIREENTELSNEVQILHLRLEELQQLPPVAMETKPHYIARPGSPTAAGQREKLLTLIALVAVGVALASWLM